MKSWQLEQIFYLNDIGKKKMALPDSRSLYLSSLKNLQGKKENIFLRGFRHLFTFIADVL